MVAANDTTSFGQISDIFNTCTAIKNTTEINFLYSHLMNGYQYMAMTNYPYPANFLEPMPAWPVNEAVKAWIDVPTAAEWAKKDDVKEEDGFIWKLFRSALGFFGINEDRATTILSVFVPQNLTPIHINKKKPVVPEKKL